MDIDKNKEDDEEEDENEREGEQEEDESESDEEEDVTESDQVTECDGKASPIKGDEMKDKVSKVRLLFRITTPYSM